jgi:hypothetical protein
VHDLISFDTAFARIESDRFNALLVLVDPFTREHRQRIVDFAAQRRCLQFTKRESLLTLVASFLTAQMGLQLNDAPPIT